MVLIQIHKTLTHEYPPMSSDLHHITHIYSFDFCLYGYDSNGQKRNTQSWAFGFFFSCNSVFAHNAHDAHKRIIFENLKEKNEYADIHDKVHLTQESDSNKQITCPKDSKT